MGEMKEEDYEHQQKEVNNGVEEEANNDFHTQIQNTKTTKRGGDEEEEEEESLVEFLDSLDNYLSLMDSLSSTLRQGWLELASARHSMGSSRINSNLLDLSQHSALTTLRLNHQPAQQCVERGRGGGTTTKEPHFTLSKWGSSSSSSSSSSTTKDNNLVQQKRSKSLSVFGGLVSPKLRAGQLSFEKALEILVDIANMRSSMLSTFEQVSNDVANTNHH